jgi:hypothetical protein
MEIKFSERLVLEKIEVPLSLKMCAAPLILSIV